MKKFTILAVFLFLTIAPNAYAADVEFSCNASDCTPSSATSFLPSTMWYPGKSATKTVAIANNTSNARTLSFKALNSSSINNLEDVMQLSIRNNATNALVWSGKLSQMYTSPVSNVTILSPNSTTTHAYTFTMDLQAGNNYQNAHTTFDLQILLEDTTTGGNTNPTITPTITNSPLSPTPSITATPNGQSENNSNSGTDSTSNSNSSSGSGGSSDSSVQGATTASSIVSTFSGLANTLGITQAIQDVAEVLGATESAEEVLASSDTGATHTDSTTVCTDNWYWLLVLAAELGIIAFILRKVQDTKRRLLYMLGTTLLATTVIFLIVCTKWYALTALLPLLALPTLKRG